MNILTALEMSMLNGQIVRYVNAATIKLLEEKKKEKKKEKLPLTKREKMLIISGGKEKIKDRILGSGRGFQTA